MQNIQRHGVIGDNMPLEWVSVEQIYREMPHPKLPKDKLRDFCEYQCTVGNLEKRTGKDKDTRQAKAEYTVSEQGKKTIALYHESIFQPIRDMISWRPKSTSKNEEAKDKENIDSVN